MAAADLEAGRPIRGHIPKAIYDYIFATEFHFLPSQVDLEDAERINGLLKVMAVCNRIKNQKINKK